MKNNISKLSVTLGVTLAVATACLPLSAFAYGVTGVSAGKFINEEKPTVPHRISTATISQSGEIIVSGSSANSKSVYNYYDQDGNIVGSAQGETIDPSATTTLANGNFLSVGQKWELKDASGSTLQKGDWVWGGNGMFSAIQLTNGNIVIAGGSGKYEIFNSDMTSLRSGSMSFASRSIYDIVELENGNIAMVGQGGNWAIADNQGKVLSSGKHKVLNKSFPTIMNITRLSDNKLMAVTQNGAYILFDKDGQIIGDGYVSGKLTTPLKSITSFPDNHVVIQGSKKVAILKISGSTVTNVFNGNTVVPNSDLADKTAVKVSNNRIFFGGASQYQIMEVDLNP
jgi:hypothetical protein